MKQEGILATGERDSGPGEGLPPVRPARMRRAQLVGTGAATSAAGARGGGAQRFENSARGSFCRCREGSAAPFRGLRSSDRVAQFGGRAQRRCLRTSGLGTFELCTRSELVETALRR